MIKKYSLSVVAVLMIAKPNSTAEYRKKKQRYFYETLGSGHYRFYYGGQFFKQHVHDVECNTCIK